MLAHVPPLKETVFPPTLTVALAGPQNTIASLPPILVGPGVQPPATDGAAVKPIAAVATATTRRVARIIEA